MTDIAALDIRVKSTGINKATRDLSLLEKGSRKVETATQRMERSFLSLKRVAVAAFAAIAAQSVIAFQAIKVGASFEQQMAKVRGIMNATALEFSALTDIAKELGATTEWSATQAAQGLEFLGMAGFSAAKSIKALPGVLDLATAGAIDLGRAADIVSNALTAMRLPVEELSRVNDVFVKTITSSNTNMEMMAESFKYSAPLAAAYGMEIETLAGLIGMLGNAGIQGSMAGTQLAFGFQNVTKVFDKYGVSLTRVDGSTKDFIDALRLLEERGASTNEVMKIFGVRAGRAALALLGQGVPAIERYIEEIKNAEGATSKLANIMRDTLTGDIKTLKSTLEDLSIAMFSTWGTDLRVLIQSVTQIIRENKDALVEFFKGMATGALSAFKAIIKGIAKLREAFLGLISIVGIVKQGFAEITIKGLELEVARIEQRIAVLQKDPSWREKTFGGSNEERREEALKDTMSKRVVLLQQIVDERQEINSLTLTQLEIEADLNKQLIDIDKITADIQEKLKAQAAIKDDISKTDKLTSDVIKGVGNSFSEVTPKINEAYEKLKAFFAIHILSDKAARDIERLTQEYAKIEEQLISLWKTSKITDEQLLESMDQLIIAHRNDLAIMVDDTENATDEIDELWINAMDRVQSTMADTFMDAMKGKLNSFKDIFRAFCDILLRYWSEMLAQMVMQSNVLRGITTSLGGILGGLFGGGGTANAASGALGDLFGIGGKASGALGWLLGMGGGGGGAVANWSMVGGFPTATIGDAGAMAIGQEIGAALCAYLGYAAMGYLVGGVIGGWLIDKEGYNIHPEWAGYGGAAGGVAGGVVGGMAGGAKAGSTWGWIGAAIGAILGGIVGAFLGGNKKRSYLGREYTYGDYSPESGWGLPEMVQYKDKRKGEKAFGESAEAMAQSGRDLANLLDSTFKKLLGIFGEDWITKFETTMGKIAAGKPSFDFYISAEDKGEFEDDWRKSWQDMTANLIAPIVAIGTKLLKEALGGVIDDSSVWNYFSVEFKEYITKALEQALGDLDIDWSKVTDQESLEAALETMGLAAENIAAIVEHFKQIGAVMDDISEAIELHGFSDAIANAVRAFKDINKTFDDFEAVLEANGVDLTKNTDLEIARGLAMEDVAYAMTLAGVSGEDLAKVLELVAATMLEAGKTAEDVAAMQTSVAEGVVRGIEDLVQGIYDALMMGDMDQYEAALYEINQRYIKIAGQLKAVNQLYDEQGNLTDIATKALAAYNLEIQRLANIILNTIRDTQRQLATMGMEPGQASLLGIASRYGIAPSALQSQGQDFLSWYAQADPQEIAEALATWGVSINQFNADMIALGNYFLNQSETQHQEAQATRNEIINSLDSAISGIDSMLADLSPTGALAPVQSAAAFRTQYENLIEQIRTSDDPGKYVSQLQSFLPDYMGFMGAYGDDYADLVASVQADLVGLNIELKSERDYLIDIAGSTANTATNTGSLLNLGIPITFDTAGLGAPAVAFLQGLQEIVALVGWNNPITFDFVSNYIGFATMPFDDFVNVLRQVAEKVPGGWYAPITMDMIMSFENWDDATLQEKIDSWHAIVGAYGWHSPVTFEFMADMVDTGDITWADIIAILPDETVEKELIMYLNNQTNMSAEDLSNIFGKDTVASMHIGADLIWPEGGFLDVVVGNAVTLAKFGNMDADTWTNNLYIGVVEMWKELVKIRKNTGALNTGLDLPSYASGGLTHGLSYAGESGSEWIVPTYEPQRSSFLKDVGADPEEIGKAVAKHLMPMSQTSKNGEGQEIHVHIEIDGQEIRNPVIIGLQGRDTELIEATRRVAQ